MGICCPAGYGNSAGCQWSAQSFRRETRASRALAPTHLRQGPHRRWALETARTLATSQRDDSEFPLDWGLNRPARGHWQVQHLEAAAERHWQLTRNLDIVLAIRATACWRPPIPGSQIAGEMKLGSGKPVSPSESPGLRLALARTRRPAGLTEAASLAVMPATPPQRGAGPGVTVTGKCAGRSESRDRDGHVTVPR